MIYSLTRRLLFQLDAEAAHELVAHQFSRLSEIDLVTRLVSNVTRPSPAAAATLWGLHFPSRIGIAAGFDKNAVMVPMLAALGFGFVEVGTVTLQPQEGNSRPRLFRLPDEKALINRLGFNNDGARVVADRLRLLNTQAQQRPWLSAPQFVNIGKNRDVSLKEAARDYSEAYRLLAPIADGIVLNVSSPNTPGLRDLQNPEQLTEILTLVRELRGSIAFERGGEHPILVKIAPDLGQQQIEEIADVCVRLADGMIATNTTVGREGLKSDPEQIGGLSGRPLFVRSTDILRRLRVLVGAQYPLIGVGGIFTSEDAIAKREAGADLLQAYTGFVYEGPAFAPRIHRALR